VLFVTTSRPALEPYSHSDRVLSPEVLQSECEVDLLRQTSVENKNAWSFVSTLGAGL
jgi:hypothetical protein